MVINLRSAAGMATIWVVAIAGVSATAWFAIDRAGRDITNASMNTLVATPPLTTPSAAQPTEAKPARTPTSTPTASVASPPPATPVPSATARHRQWHRHSETPTPSASRTGQVRSVTVQGGQVTARCLGTGIRLQVAQPENGWRVQVDYAGSRHIIVTFRTGEEEETRQTQVAALCNRGIPVFDISNR